MPFARLASTIRVATIASLFALLTITAWAQEQPSAPMPQNTPEARPLPVMDYTKPASHFPNLIAPYQARHLAPPNLANTSRIDQLMHDGKLYLSLNDAVALALENNLDIAIARYNLNIARTLLVEASAASVHPQALPPAAPAWGPAESALEPTAWSVPPSAKAHSSPASTLSLPARCRMITPRPYLRAYSTAFRSLHKIPVP
jgi:hypothetical protein